LQTAGAEITSLDAAVLGGKLHATGSLAAGGKPEYKLSGSFEQLNPELVSELLGLKGSGGPIDGAGHIELAGYTDKELSASAKGELRFDWSRGSLAGSTDVSVPAALARFDHFSGDATIANGALTVGKNEIRRGSRTSTAAATVRFAIPATVEFGP
jgi:AsmA-like C-terminal region